MGQKWRRFKFLSDKSRFQAVDKSSHFCQESQQFQFLRRHLQPSSLIIGGVFRDADRQPREAQIVLLVLLASLGSSQHSLDPGDHLLGIKGLQGETASYFVRSQNSALLTSASISGSRIICTPLFPAEKYIFSLSMAVSSMNVG